MEYEYKLIDTLSFTGLDQVNELVKGGWTIVSDKFFIVYLRRTKIYENNP